MATRSKVNQHFFTASKLFSSTTRDINVQFHGTNAERSMVIGQCQLKLQLIPGFIRKSIEPEIIETQFSLESNRNVEQDKIFMFWIFKNTTF